MGGREPVIREIKWYVYSVMAHILWSGAKCGVLEGKQIAGPGTRLCLFLLLSLESHKKMWALKTNVQLKTVLRWFISLMLDCSNTLPYLQWSLQACCRDVSGAKISLAHKLCCSPQLYVQPWVVTLHFPMPSSYSHCFKHCNTVTMCGGFLCQFDRPCCVFVSAKDSRPFLPSLTHTHTLSAWKKNTFMSYCICKTENLPLVNPAQIFTVDSQVLVQSSWRELTSVLPFDTRHEWKTRQTRFPHKGLEGSSSISEAACSAGFIRVHRHRDAHIWHAQEKPLFNYLICCIFHGSRHTYSVSDRVILFHHRSTSYTAHNIYWSVYVPSQRSRAQVTTVLLSLAQWC